MLVTNFLYTTIDNIKEIRKVLQTTWSFAEMVTYTTQHTILTVTIPLMPGGIPGGGGLIPGGGGIPLPIIPGGGIPGGGIPVKCVLTVIQ